MITRTIDSRLPLIAYNPTGVFSFDYLKEIGASGALPAFDTDFIDPDKVIQHIQELESNGILFALRININSERLMEYVNNNYISTLSALIITYDSPEDLDPSRLTTDEYKVYVELFNIGLAQEAEAFMPSAVIVRGNEAPGRVSSHTSFLLLQWYIENSSLPVLVHGGVGEYTGAGMFAAGASGLVLDDQLYLVDESPLADNFKDAVRKMEEKDSVLVGQSLGRQYRFHCKLSTKIVKELKEKESKLVNEEKRDDILFDEIKTNIAHVDNVDAPVVQSLFYLGPDAILQKTLSVNPASSKIFLSSSLSV